MLPKVGPSGIPRLAGGPSPLSLLRQIPRLAALMHSPYVANLTVHAAPDTDKQLASDLFHVSEFLFI